METFMRASVEAIPSGKQNTFAAHNPPSLVFGLVRNEGAPWSLANAFESPVRASGKGIVDASMLRLNEYYGALKKMYGGEPSEAVWTALEQSENLGKLGCREDSIEGFIQAIMKALPGAGS